MQRKLTIIGVLVLFSGCCVGGLVYWSGARSDVDRTTEESPLLSDDNSKQARREVEIYGGQMSLLVNSMSRAWEEWKHPKPVGLTIAAASWLAAFIIFLIARSRPAP